MARPLRIEFSGAFYHVTSRGNEEKEVFKSQKDREKFLDYLATASSRYGAVIHAFCLMGNHYHLLLETPDGNLSQIMRHINGAYTTYFNSRRKRAGHLFQGRYKAVLVEAEAYATELTRYIHLNPVRAGITVCPETYPWSSYRGYIGQTATPKWLRTGFILDTFALDREQAQKKYQQFVEDLLLTDYESPLKRTVASTLLGSAAFIAGITEQHLVTRRADQQLPALKKLVGVPALDAIIAGVGRAVAPDADLTKKLSLYFCHRYSGANLREIGERFEMSDSAVCQVSRRILLRAQQDERVKAAMEKVALELGLTRV